MNIKNNNNNTGVDYVRTLTDNEKHSQITTPTQITYPPQITYPVPEWETSYNSPHTNPLIPMDTEISKFKDSLLSSSEDERKNYMDYLKSKWTNEIAEDLILNKKHIKEAIADKLVKLKEEFKDLYNTDYHEIKEKDRVDAMKEFIGYLEKVMVEYCKADK